MYFRKRLEKLKKLLNKNKISNYIETDNKNVLYLTGFNDCPYFFLITEKNFYIVLPEMLKEQCESILQENNIFDLVKVIVISKKQANINSTHLYFSSIKDILIYIKTNDNLKILFYSEVNRKFFLYKILDNIFEIKDCFSVVHYLRMTKDNLELKYIKKACLETYKISKKIPSFFETRNSERLTELDISKKIDILSIKNCGDKSFDTIVAFGENTSFPHYIPSEKIFYKSDSFKFLADFGAKYKNYCADMTITFFKNLNDDLYKKIFDAVSEAHLKAIEMIKPGILAKDLDLKVREVFDKYKLTEYFLHSTGHGVGLDIHESPSINYLDSTLLKENMVITIEPGLYIKNIGGVRIEDTVLITKNGYKILTSS